MITPANNTTLTFNLADQVQALAYTNLVSGLIDNNIAYGTQNKGVEVIIRFGGVE
jgi:hypothetical protein